MPSSGVLFDIWCYLKTVTVTFTCRRN